MEKKLKFDSCQQDIKRLIFVTIQRVLFCQRFSFTRFRFLIRQ